MYRFTTTLTGTSFDQALAKTIAAVGFPSSRYSWTFILSPTVPQGRLTHMRTAASTRSQRTLGGACPSHLFGPFNWHNLAFDPFKLSHLRTNVRCARVSVELPPDREAVGTRRGHSRAR